MVWSMRYHLNTMRARWDAPYNFCEVTEQNALAPFVATPMLLAAPKAWRIWCAIITLRCMFNSHPYTGYTPVLRRWS